MTEEKLYNYLLPRLQLWKERLGLQNWEIALRVVRGKEIEGNQGQCEYTPAILYATIKVLSPLDWIDEYHNKYALEGTMVHELIHLLFYSVCPEDKTSVEYYAIEQGITRIERALIGGYVKQPVTIKLERGQTCHSLKLLS